MHHFLKRSCLYACLIVPVLAMFALSGCGGGEDAAEDSETGPSETSEAAVASPDVIASDPTPEAQPDPVVPEPPAPDNPRAVDTITSPDGYQVELLHAPDKKSEGSWVALCNGPDGTLFATDESRGGDATNALYHIKPAAIGDYDAKTEVIQQPVEIRGAMGLYYAFDSLYVMDYTAGLLRVTDSDNDGLMDSKELIVPIPGGRGEHGSHAILPTPDGKGLYIICGNSTPPADFDDSVVPLIYDEDQVLPREPDARGHAAGRLAPGGWIARCDPDGSNLTLFSVGFRNAYDFGMNPQGELFAYDADMEWDLGLPWYRPTRINHAVSGSEFGWRNGSGKWPAYFEDSLPAVVDIGPGSPVGVTFGTGADFPTKYQSAMFALDWTFGIIYAIHMEPDGATYTGTYEPFISGKPLPLTDVCIGEDGAMYFTAGGRGLDSGLYRVVYYGNKDKTPPAVEPLTERAQLRRQLETLHKPGISEGELDTVWANLGHSDRFVRFAARTALEHQDVARYLDKAKAETDALTKTSAGLALARHRHADALGVLLGADPTGLNDAEARLAWLRAVGVAFARNGQPTDSERDQVLAKLAKLVPSDDAPTNIEVVRLRVFLNDESVIQFTLDLMNNAPTPTPPAWLALAAQNDRYGAALKAMAENPPATDQINLAFMLRNMEDGWTPTTRQAYFGWLNLAQQGGGGRSFQGYINNIREQAVATLTEQEKASLGPLLEAPPENLPPVVTPKGPGRNWTTAQATALVDGKLDNRDFERGQGLYQAVLCAQCHRVADLGGQIGPDLTSVVHTYSLEDLMRAIIEPSADMTDQYALTIVTTKAGEQIIGTKIDENEQGVTLKLNILSDEVTLVPRDQVASVELSPTSPMPQGLINAMSANELRDLTAYILSKGDRDDPMFKD